MDDRNRTPLHLAASKGRQDVADVLIESGANLHARDVNNYRPMDMATDPLIRQRLTAKTEAT